MATDKGNDIISIINFHGNLSKRIKQYEHSTNQYPPENVVNELRYSLRAAMELLRLYSYPNNKNLEFTSSPDCAEAIDKLKLSLEIAYCDLLEVLTIDVTDSLAKLRDNYWEETIAVLGSQSRDILELIGKLNKEISETRANPSARTSTYQKLYEQHFDSLLSHNQYLKGDALDQIMRLYKKNKNKQLRNTLALVFGAIGTIFGVASFLLG